MGTVPNVGLMAQKAEEYGSPRQDLRDPRRRDGPGRRPGGDTLLEHEVEAGDIWRACQTKDAAVRDWVKLAVTRARATGWPAVFWLDETRAHDAELIAKVRDLPRRARHRRPHDRDHGVAEATRFTPRARAAGEDTISVTGNVLRDYLTDLFPILELGTSAKMLSIVPLMNGGGLFETGAGGSAPKHVQQFVKENHLRWDSLGEFLALAASLEHLADSRPATPGPRCWPTRSTPPPPAGSRRAARPSRKVGRARQPRQPLLPRPVLGPGAGRQTDDAELAERSRPLAERWRADEETIVDELNAVPGSTTTGRPRRLLLTALGRSRGPGGGLQARREVRVLVDEPLVDPGESGGDQRHVERRPVGHADHLPEGAAVAVGTRGAVGAIDRHRLPGQEPPREVRRLGPARLDAAVDLGRVHDRQSHPRAVVEVDRVAVDDVGHRALDDDGRGVAPRAGHEPRRCGRRRRARPDGQRDGGQERCESSHASASSRCPGPRG
jgi:hypothetical protein